MNQVIVLILTNIRQTLSQLLSLIVAKAIPLGKLLLDSPRFGD